MTSVGVPLGPGLLFGRPAARKLLARFGLDLLFAAFFANLRMAREGFQPVVAVEAAPDLVGGSEKRCGIAEGPARPPSLAPKATLRSRPAARPGPRPREGRSAVRGPFALRGYDCGGRFRYARANRIRLMAQIVKPDEIIARCRAIAELSEQPGCTTRTFLSPPMREVHRILRTWMESLGMSVSVDAAGNLRGHYAGTRSGCSAAAHRLASRYGAQRGCFRWNPRRGAGHRVSREPGRTPAAVCD